jgi:hypothetical protein
MGNLTYSALAEFALFVGQLGALLGAAVSLAVAVFSVLGGNPMAAFLAVLGFLQSFAFAVVFARVRDMDSGRRLR